MQLDEAKLDPPRAVSTRRAVQRPLKQFTKISAAVIFFVAGCARDTSRLQGRIEVLDPAKLCISSPLTDPDGRFPTPRCFTVDDPRQVRLFHIGDLVSVTYRDSTVVAVSRIPAPTGPART